MCVCVCVCVCVCARARSLTFVLLAKGNFTMEPNEQNQHLEKYVYTNTTKMFSKFGCQTRTFCNKKEEKMVSQAWVRQSLVTTSHESRPSVFLLA